jgi:PAS domain S-box-containing protein
MSTPLRVLILEDQPSDVELMLHELRLAGFEPDPQVVGTAADYLGQLEEDLDVILSDYTMPQFNALEALHLLLDCSLDVPFIVVTGAVSEEVAVECMRQGADDYVLKDRITRLGEAVRNALREKRLRDEKRQAEEALQRRNRELELLNCAGQVFSSTLELDQVLTAILDEVRRLMDVVGSSIWLVDPETDELVCRHATGSRNKVVIGWRLAPGEGIAGATVRTGESLISSDAQADERYFRGVDKQTRLALRSILSTPLQVRQRVIGVLQVVDTEVDRFDAGDLALLEPLAVSAAIAVENARLYHQVRQELTRREQAEEALRRRDAILETVSYGAERFLRGGEWEPHIQEILGRLGRAMGVSRVYIFENFVEGEQLMMRQKAEWAAPGASSGIDHPEHQRIPYAGMEHWVETLGKGDILCRHTYDLSPQVREVFTEQDTMPIAIVPIFVGSEWWGFIGFDECKTGREWSAVEMDALKAAANTVGAAIQRQQAEAALQESEERCRIVSELTSDFAYGYRVKPDGDLVHLWVTGALRRLTGLTADELRARGGWEALVHPDDVPISLSQLRALLAGQAKVVEYRIVTQSGDVRWVRNYARPEWGEEQGRTIGVYGAMQDITERKEAEERLHRYARRLQILHEVDRAILAAQSPEDIAEAALSHIQDLVPCISASVVEFDWEASQATVHAISVGDETGPRASRRVPLEASGIAEALRHGQIDVVDDIRALLEQTPADEALLAEGVRSYVNLPLFAQGELLGSLNLGAAEPAAFGQEQIEIAREVADQLALAVLQARLAEAEQRRTAELVRSNVLIAALGKVATHLQTGLDPDEVMETLGTELGRLGITCMIAVLDPAIQALVVQYHSLDPETLVTAERLVGLTLHGFPIPRERFPIYDELIERRQAVFVPDLVLMGSVLVPPSVPPSTVERVFELFRVTSGVRIIWLPLTTENRILGCLCLWGKNLEEIDIPTFSMFAGQVAITLEKARLFEEIRVGRERLQALSRRLLDVQETERRHIARDLHDEVGQVLTGVKLLLEMSKSSPVESVGARLEQALALVDELAASVQELSLDLRPAMLDDLGLLPTLAWHFGRYTRQTKVQVDFKYIGLEKRVAPEIETAAYRIVQEALTNVARHADVSEVSVRLWLDQDALRVQIEDEGVGFDSEAALAAGITGGLSGMQERATLLGGELRIESTPGAGTFLLAEFPLLGTATGRTQGKQNG